MSRFEADGLAARGGAKRRAPMWSAVASVLLALSGAARGQAPAPCATYDRWSVLDAGPLLDDAEEALEAVGSCSGAAKAECDAVYETGGAALDHVIQVFNGAAADSRKDCLRCSLALLLPAAERVTALGRELEAKGYSSAASLVGAYATVSSWEDTPYCGSAGPCAALGGAWRMGGPYNVGRPTRIAASGGGLVFTNENGQSSRGTCRNPSLVTALDWGNLVGRVAPSGKRIDWANKTWWVR